MRFGFGRNWSDFIRKHYSEERVAASREKLLGFLRLPDLTDKSFLDIGCGSGLHSLAAWRAGAASVLSFDYDEHSVATTRFLWEREGKPANWRVEQGSVLDRAYMERLPKSDIVYSWGVLHHTGDVWTAIKNAALPLKQSSLFFIALYSHDVKLRPSAEFWLRLKRRYNRSGRAGRLAIELWYYLLFFALPDLLSGRNPLRTAREYSESRGMSVWTDVRDWVGGWPMEFVKIAEAQRFFARELGLELLDMTSSEANAEYLLRKAGAGNDWDGVLSRRVRIPLAGPFSHVRGRMFRAPLPEAAARAKRFFVMEDGLRLQLPNAPAALIEKAGGGRYARQGNELFFSSSDGSDPGENGRAYVLVTDPD